MVLGVAPFLEERRAVTFLGYADGIGHRFSFDHRSGPQAPRCPSDQSGLLEQGVVRFKLALFLLGSRGRRLERDPSRLAVHLDPTIVLDVPEFCPAQGLYSEIGRILFVVALALGRVRQVVREPCQQHREPFGQCRVGTDREAHREVSNVPPAALARLQVLLRSGAVALQTGLQPQAKQVDATRVLLHEPAQVVVPEPLAGDDRQNSVRDMKRL